MLRSILLVMVTFLLSACTGGYDVRSISPYVGDTDLMIGIVADSQFQNREHWAVKNDLRDASKDRLINVTIRPPALVATARELLLAHLTKHEERGVTAIFYLGDGANHGCRSELSGANGLFPTLTEFRDRSRIPIFYIVGNHDFLAAGNASNSSRNRIQDSMCGTDGWVKKRELIGLIEQFNADSATIHGLQYLSSVNRGKISSDRCSADTGLQLSRLPSCYYAGIIDLVTDGRTHRFLLADTNDYVDVTSSKYPFAGQVEGTRGAISFRDSETVTSQTNWFVETQRNLQKLEPAAILVGLSHYDVPALRKQVPFIVLSRKTQLLANLFVDPASGQNFFREGAFFASAHTHTQKMKKLSTGITKGGETILSLAELNVGSTTDYPSLSTIVRFSREGSEPRMSYEPVRPSDEGCADVLSDLNATVFPDYSGAHGTGRDAVFLNEQSPFAYRDLNDDQPGANAVFARLDTFIGNAPHRAVCLGLEAGRLEAGK